MVSPYALLVVALGLLWFASDPLPPHSRALAGDGVPGLLFALLALAAVGVSRLQGQSAHPLPEGPPAFAGLGAREPTLLLGLAGLGALACGGLDSFNWWLAALLWLGVSFWYARAGETGRGFAVPLGAMAVCLMTLGLGPFGWSPLLAATLGAAAATVVVHIWMARRVGLLRAERFWRAVLPLGALLVLPVVWPISRETVFRLDPYFYFVLPITWMLLWSLGEGARALFPERLDSASGSLRLGRGVWLSTRAWVWFLGLQLGGQAAKHLDVVSLSIPWTALVVLLALLVALMLGTAARRALHESSNAAPEPSLGLALAPLLAPLLVLGCLRIAPLPAAWGEFSHLRGTMALLAPALALPLCGAVLLVAACIDRTRGRGFPVFVGAIGAVLLLAGAFAFGPFVSRWHPGFLEAGLQVGGLAPCAAVLMGLAAAACDQRLRQVQRGQPVRSWSLLLLPVGALSAGSVLVPSIGLLGATTAASLGLVATMLADRLPLPRRAYTTQAA